jgi:hypothetical protein
MHSVQTNFTLAAEKLLDGASGLLKFNYDIHPNVGDKLTVKTSPNMKVLSFVCIERHFDFSKTEEPQIVLLFDVLP